MYYSRDFADPSVSRCSFDPSLDVMLMSPRFGAAEQTQFDDGVSRMSRGLSVAGYSFVMDLVTESLAAETSEQDLACLVHLSTMLLHETPEGTAFSL